MLFGQINKGFTKKQNKINLKFKNLQLLIKWEAKVIIHLKEQRIAVWFENIPSVNAGFRKLPNVKWSKTLSARHLPDTIQNTKKFATAEENQTT